MKRMIKRKPAMARQVIMAETTESKGFNRHNLTDHKHSAAPDLLPPKKD
jgi:hypothetical protein